MKLVMMIEAVTVNEFKQAVEDLHALVGLQGSVQQKSANAGTDCTSAVKSAKKKTTDKEPVAEVEEKSIISASALRAAPSPAVEPLKNDPFAEDGAVSETKEITFDDIRFALQTVADKVGMDKASEVTESFGAKKISGIKKADYPSFIQKCNEITA